MAMSEQQKKDLKFKIWCAVTVVIIATPILLIGPGISMVRDNYSKKPLDPVTPKRFLTIAKIQNNTMRPEGAKETLEEFFTKFVDEEQYDFSGVYEGYGIKIKYYPDGLAYGDHAFAGTGFTPWLFPEERPAALQNADKKTLGEALDLYAKVLEDVEQKQKGYMKASYIYTCMLNMWDQGTPGHEAALDGRKRISIRAY